MKFLISFLCASFLWMPESAAQLKLRGRLINATTKAAIYPGTVFVLGTEHSGQSNEKGEFVISSSALPPGDTLTIMASAYQFEARVLAFPLAGSTLEINDIEIELYRYMRQTASEDRPSFMVSGRVVDEMMAGLPNVNIVAANIRGETVTTTDGKFDLRIDQIRPIDKTELWFSKPGYITERLLLSALRKKRYTVKLVSAVVLAKSRAKPSKNLAFKFVDAVGRPLPGVTIRIDGKSIGETDLLGFYHLTLGENAGDAVKVDYFYKSEPNGSGRTVVGDTLLRLNAINDSVKIQIDPFHQTLWVKTFSSDKVPLRKVKITTGNITGTTDISGKVRLKVTNPRGELLATKAGFVEARIKYEINGNTDSVEIMLSPIPPAPPPKKFVVAVRESGSKNKPVPGALVRFGEARESANGKGEVVFENPRFLDTLTLSAEKEGFERWSHRLPQELSNYEIWLKRKPTAFKLTVIDSINFALIPNPVAILVGGNEVKADSEREIMIHSAKRGDKITVRANGYRPKEFTLPDSVGESMISLARLQENRHLQFTPDTPNSGSKTNDVAKRQKKLAGIANFVDIGLIGPAWWRFTREDTSTLKPGSDRKFPLWRIYLEKSFPGASNGANPLRTAFRVHWLAQASQKITNVELGFDFLWRPFSNLGLVPGLRGAYYRFKVAGIKSVWLTPFISLGLELDAPDGWFQKIQSPVISIRSIGIRYSRDNIIFDHFHRVSIVPPELTRAENLEAPRARNSISLVLKTNRGILRAGCSSLSPPILVESTRLKDISTFFVSYGFAL